MLLAFLVASAVPAQWQAVDAVAQIVQFSGFETGDFSEFDSVTGGASVQGAVVHGGNRAMRCLTGSAPSYAHATMFRESPDGTARASLNLVDMYVSFWFRFAQANNRSRIAEVGGVGPVEATKIRLELEPNRRLSVQDFLDGGRVVGTQMLAPDTWYRIRWYVGTGTVAGTLVMIDDSVDISVPDANLSDQPTRRFHIGRSSTSGGAIEFYYDDLIISTGGFADDCEARLVLPNGTGSHDQWTGSFGGVTDWPHDVDATYSESTGDDTAMTFTLQDAAAAGITTPVVAVKALAVTRRTGGSLDSAVRLRSGGTDFDTEPGDPGSVYCLRSRLYQLDPATGLAWTHAGLDGLEIGAFNDSGPGTTRMTAVGASVLIVRP